MNKKNKGLHQLIFFVTSRCNSRCSHCFNWKNVNKKDDLDFDKIVKVSESLPDIENLLLSGGEPFLRRELVDIIKIFRKNNNINSVSIPTNGLLGQKIVDTTKKILEIPCLDSVHVNFSLDGFRESHDKIRGIPDNFKITLNTIKLLQVLKADYPGLRIMVNSVICENNHKELLELADYLKNKKLIDNHYFEIIRDYDDNKKIDKDLDFDLYKKFLHYQYDYFKNQIKGGNFLKNIIRKMMFLGSHLLIYKIQHKNRTKNKPWPFKCSAGRNIIVMQSDGLIQICEPRQKEFKCGEDMNIKKILKSKEFTDEIRDIGRGKCYCSHTCFIGASIRLSRLTRYLLIPFYGLVNYLIYENFSNNSNV